MYGIHRPKKTDEGRLITGPGTGTSDSIKTQVPAGSYILPADSTQQLDLGVRRKQVPVNVSNGEYELSPDQVHAIGANTLDAVKAATHQPTDQQQGGELFFANGGLVDPEEQLRRAERMAAQGQQPVYGPNNPPPVEREPSRLAQGDLAKTAAAGARWLGDQPKSLGPTVRLGVRRPDQPAPASQPVAAPSMAKPSSGQAPNEWALGVSRRAADSAIEALKDEPAIALAPNTLLPTAAGNGWIKTDIGDGRQGGAIAVRSGEGGVTEFTNATASPDAVAGAAPMPIRGFGARRSASKSTQAPALQLGARRPVDGQGQDEQLAALGSASKIGNGVGTFSVMGEAGDAQNAIATFDRANEIRAGARRTRELGDNGGKVTVVRDSARAPTVTELVNERRDLQLRGADRADRLADSRINAETQGIEQDSQRLALDTARGQVDLAGAEASLQTNQTLESIRQALADPSLTPEQRQQLESSYYAMTTPAKDRYMTVEGGVGEMGAKEASKVLDRRTGQYVGAGQRRTSVSRAEVEQAAKSRGMTPEQVEQMLADKGVSVSG